jgi:hypothetical protein
VKHKKTDKETSGSKQYARPADRGLGPDGGAWNLKQASEWCGIGENHLRTMAKAKQIPVAFYIGRRILLPREGFKVWFNTRRESGNAA